MSTELQIRELGLEEILARHRKWEPFCSQFEPRSVSRHPAWLEVLQASLGQQATMLEAVRGEETVGLLPLALVKSWLFGRFLVSLPYLNTAGVMAEEPEVARRLVDHAVSMADRLDVRYLELRHEKPIEHPAFNHEMTSKVHMRLTLPTSAERLWDQFTPKVRNQIRKAENQSLAIEWVDNAELLHPRNDRGWRDKRPIRAFYAVFSRNMRDLGTPVYPPALFENIMSVFPHETEICLVRLHGKPIAGALLLHGKGITEVPSASSLREFNFTNANMLMYWHLLRRAVERGQHTFDFGRSSADSNTYRFKKQWGAEPSPAVWQYYVRQGDVSAMRPDSSKNQRLIRLWRKLPVWVSRQIGPLIVRGIP